MSRVLLVLAVAACSYPKLPAAPRGPEVAAADTVELTSACSPFGDDWPVAPDYASGTGVIVDARHVLTAAHVVRCAALPEVHATLPDGTRVRLVVVQDRAMFGDGTDEAMLEILSADSLGKSAPPTLSRNDARGPWCAQTRHGRACGSPTMLVTDWGVFEAQTRPGDSGAGVYDADGRLLGLVVSGSKHYTKFVRVTEEMLP